MGSNVFVLLNRSSFQSPNSSAPLAALICVCLLLCSLNVLADGKPEIKSKSLAYITTGHMTTLTLYGENLAPKSVTAGKPQVTVKLGTMKATEGDDKKKGSRQVSIELTPSADCPRENIDLTITQPDGTKATTQIPIVEATASEMPVKKPNTSYTDAMPLTLTPALPSLAVTGNVEGDNPTTFRFEVKAGETWRFQVFAGRGDSTLDPVLRVRDSKHLSLSLQAGNPKQDLTLQFTAPATGTYYLELMDDQSRGGAAFTFRLTVQKKN